MSVTRRVTLCTHKKAFILRGIHYRVVSQKSVLFLQTQGLRPIKFLITLPNAECSNTVRLIVSRNSSSVWINCSQCSIFARIIISSLAIWSTVFVWYRLGAFLPAPCNCIDGLCRRMSSVCPCAWCNVDRLWSHV